MAKALLRWEQKQQQHDAHVKTWDRWIHEEDRRWTRRLRGEEGPPPNFDPEAVRAVLAALQDDKRKP